MLANGPDKPDGDAGGWRRHLWRALRGNEGRSARWSVLLPRRGAVPVNSNAMSWNADMVTTTGNVIVDLLHNFHLDAPPAAQARVDETVTDLPVPGLRLPAGPGSVYAHAYALALKKLTGVELEKFLPLPTFPWAVLRSARRLRQSGSHRRLYTFSPSAIQKFRHLGRRRRGRPPGRSAG